MKNKKIIFGISIMCIIVISITLILITNKSSSKILDSNLENTTDNLDNKAPGMFAIMLETERGSGKYEQSTSGLWPDSGYVFNSTLSTCENGGVLTWNEENRTVNLKSNLSDRCYLYFDIVPPDVTINTNNNDNYNASTPASLSCTGATAEYNQKYQRIEISSIANKYTSCNLTYQTPSSKTYLNDYVIGLSGTTQGTGEVVNEGNIQLNNQNPSSPIAQSEYGNYSTYYNTGFYTSGTNVSNVFSFDSSSNMWVTNPDNMENSLFYHIKYTIPENGYYKVCAYALSDDNNSSRIYLSYRNSGTSAIFQNINDTGESYCVDTEYLTAGSNGYLLQVTGDSGTPGKFGFTVQKYQSSKEVNAGIRYEGKDPNNYIWFNNELWRIIGVFDEATHGVSGQNLVKIIRADSIGGLAWHKSNTNDWTASSLMNLLNGAYLNSQNGTGGEYCYGYSTTTPGNCDYTETGINATYRPMIENVTWHLGGYSSESATAEAFYGYERGTTVYSGRPTTATGYIGLMYPSDYGYSVLASSCARTTNLGDYDSATCAGQSWLYGQGYEWTITPRSSNSDGAFRLRIDGYVNAAYANVGLAVRPVLYLDSSVYVIDGNGSISDPYIIGM